MEHNSPQAEDTTAKATTSLSETPTEVEEFEDEDYEEDLNDYLDYMFHEANNYLEVDD